MKVTKNLTEGNIYKNYLLYALPLIFSALLGNLYSTVDAVIAGKFINEYALGAISATASYDNVFHSLFSGFGVGFSVYVAQLFGKGEKQELKKDILNVLTFIAGVSGAVSILSIAFCDPIMDFLNVDPILRNDAKIYFVIYTSGYIITYINALMMYSLYSLGITSFTLYVSLASAIINIGGNLLSVLVLDIGVAGLAISTVLSKIVTTFFYVHMLRRAFRELSPEKTQYRFSFSSVRRSLHFTIPAAVQQVVFHVISLFSAPAINALGAAATTGYSVTNQMYGICSLTIWNTTSAVSCYTAQCVGEGKYDKIPKGLKSGFILNCALLLPLVLVFAIFAKPLASLYFPAGFEGEAFGYAVRFSRVYLPFLYITMTGHIMHAYLRSLGCMNIVFAITVFTSLVLAGGTLLLVPYLYMEGVFIAKLVSWICDALVSVSVYALFFRTQSQIKRAAKKYSVSKK